MTGLSFACRELERCKLAEQAAKGARLEAEQEVLSLVHTGKLEGTTTTVTDGYKVAVTNKVTRKLDVSAYEELQLPTNLQFVDYKPSINLKRLRAVEMVDPSLTALCTTVKPAKASIKLTSVTDTADGTDTKEV